MSILKYKYHCSVCNEDKYSYFPDVPYCVYCNSKKITKTDISHLKIDKFSEEGMRLRKKEIETDWRLKGE